MENSDEVLAGGVESLVGGVEASAGGVETLAVGVEALAGRRSAHPYVSREEGAYCQPAKASTPTAWLKPPLQRRG